MRRVVLTLAAFAVALTATARADDAATKIIDKAVKAHGGVDALKKEKEKSAILKGKIAVQKPVEFEGTMEMFTGGKKFKQVIEGSVMGQNITQIVSYDGKSMWISINGMIVKEFKDKELEPITEMIGAEETANLALLKSKDVEVAVIGDDKVNDKPVVGLRLTRKGHKEVSVYYDKETGLMSKIEFRGPDILTMTEKTQSRIMSDYKERDGIKRPMRITVLADGDKTSEVEIIEAKTVDKLDDNTFDKP